MHMDYGLNLNVLSCFFFKQKTAYEMRISDWSSDVCSSDLLTENPDEAVDAGFFRARIAEAVCLRRESLRLDDVSDAWRVVHSERAQERSVGKECVSTCRSRWSPVQ